MKKKILIVAGAILLLGVVLAGWVMVQQAQAVAQVEQEWQTVRVEKISNLGATRSLDILPLFEEAAARGDLEPEHGVSYLVKTDRQNILLDVGMTPARLSRNLQTLGITEKNFQTVFLTHAHLDHTGGMSSWWDNRLIPGDPPLDLRGKRVYLPMPLNVAGGAPVVAAQPVKLADGLASTGAIAFPELFPFSLRSPRNTEQALAVNVQGKGIVLIMGCGHPTVERIVARAQALFDEPIIGIVGGLHYDGMTREQVQSHIAFISTLKPQFVALSPHDSSAEALQAFRDTFGTTYQDIQVGRTLTLGGSSN